MKRLATWTSIALEQHGFRIEEDVYAEAGQGRLILTNYATLVRLRTA